MTLSRKQRRANKAKMRKKGAQPPSDIQHIMNIAIQHHQKGDVITAAKCYQQVLQVAPHCHEALHLLGVLCYQKGDFSQAIALIARAVELDASIAAYHNNLANALVAAGHHDKAVEQYKLALSIQPDYPEAINNIGAVLHELGRWQEEMQYYQQNQALHPNDGSILNELIKTKRDACDWQGLDDQIAKLILLSKDAMARHQLPPLTPYHALTLDIEPALKHSISRSYSEQKITKPGLFGHQQHNKSKLRIGYVSADFRDHPTAHLIKRMLALHNREQFEVFAYSLGKDDKSVFRQSIEQSCDHFVDLYGATHLAAAQRMHDDGIDILLDVMGHIQNAQPEIFACRPAPIQVNYLAYPGSMGASFIDYLVTDHVAVPDEHLNHYSEAKCFMPNSYFVTDDTQQIGTVPSRHACGLPEKGMVFCCFNKSSKIDATIFKAWMDILKACEGSVLWLYVDNEITCDNLRTKAIEQGVGQDRLVFATRVAKEQHLARLCHADLFLDCSVVNAHTTAIDALWAGVPVLSVAGDHIISRASASILSAMQLDELIANDIDHYKEQAITLASNSDALARLKRKVADNRGKTSLFDTTLYVSHLEKAFQKMWAVYSAGDTIRDIEVV